MSPELLNLANACYLKINWAAAEAAAQAYARKLQLPEASLEVFYFDEHTLCQCSCGHKHSIVRRAGIYFNGCLVSALVEESDVEEYRRQRRKALGY